MCFRLSGRRDAMVDMSLVSGTLTIHLPKIINTENALAIDQEIRGSDALAASERIVIDAKELRYISSLGLRILLAAKKMKDDLKIVNVNETCYQIFEEAGFTEIMEITRIARFISLDGMKALGSGINGSVYEINREKVLKVYHGLTSMDEVSRILHTVRQAFVRGIPTMIPYEVVQTEKGYGTVFEMVDSACFANEIAKNPDKVKEAAAALAGLARKLASTDLSGSGVISRRELLLRSVSDITDLFDPEEIDAVRYYVEAVPDRNTAVHGDLHARNIMVVNGELLLIDMDDFSEGHPVWELAAIDRIYHMVLLLDPGLVREIYMFPQEVALEDFLEKVSQIPVDLIRILWDGFTECYFEGVPPESKEACLALSDFYALFMMMRDVLEQIRSVREEPEKLEDRKQVFRKLLGQLRGKDFASIGKAFELWTI